MPNTTARAAIRSPLGTEAADAPTGMQNLANDVDAKLFIWLTGTTAGKPASATNGRAYYETDGDRLSYDQGTTWRKVLIQTADGKYTADAVVNATGFQIGGVDIGTQLSVPTGLLAARPAAGAGNNGHWYYATDQDSLSLGVAGVWVRIGDKPGDMVQTLNAVAATGRVLYDGSLVSRVGLYADLFAKLGTAYGVGDGSTTFGLPDLRGYIPVVKGTHADVNTIANSSGEAVANRRPKHPHSLTGAPGIGNIGVTNAATDFDDVFPGDDGATGGHVSGAGTPNRNGGARVSSHTHAATVTGAPTLGTIGVGVAGANADAPSYFTVNVEAKL